MGGQLSGGVADQDVLFLDKVQNGADPPYFPPIQFSQIVLGDAFIGDRGYVHMAVHWDRSSLAMNWSDPDLIRPGMRLVVPVSLHRPDRGGPR